MSTQQDIYAAGFETRRPMLNKDNYVPWSSHNLIPEPGDPDSDVYVNETFHEQTDDELTKKELKQVEADDVTPLDGARTEYWFGGGVLTEMKMLVTRMMVVGVGYGEGSRGEGGGDDGDSDCEMVGMEVATR
ncbi:hypothetical protein Tco_0503088 [Tanacetum coccineum]